MHLTAAPETAPTAGLPGAARLRQAAPYLLALGLGVLVHAMAVALGMTPVLDGQLHGTDGYMRLVRVTELFQTGAWYDVVIERSNAPYGTVMHWTRPFDLLLLAGAGALAPWLGFKQGLFWWAAAVGPLLHVAMVCCLIWATAPILSRQHRCLLVLTALAQVPLVSTGAAGRADHHMLITLAFVLAVGLTLRLVIRPFYRRLALAAGAATGFGLWLTMEALVLMAAGFAATGLTWLLQGGEAARKNQWHALGLAGLIAVALLVERPPSALLAEEYDRIAAVHLLVALLALAFWTAVRALERRRPDAWAPGRRAGLGALGAGLAGALLHLAYPKFFGGPEVDVDPRLDRVFFELVNELKPLLPSDVASLGRFLAFLGPSVVVVPYLGFRLVRGRRDADWHAWLYLAVCMAFFLPLALGMLRFAPFTEVLLAVVLAELLGRLLARLEGVRILPLRAVLRAGLATGLLTGFLGLGAGLSGAAEAPPSAAACDLR